MGVQMRWDNEDRTVMRHVFGNYWDWQDLFDVINQTRALLDIHHRKVDLIVDLSNTRWVPPSPTLHFRYLMDFLTHPYVGRVVIVSTSQFVEEFGNICIKVSGKIADRVQFVSTLTEAYQVLLLHPQ